MKHLITIILIFFVAISCRKEETEQTYNASFEVLPRIEYVAPRPPAKPDSPKDIPSMRVTDLSTKESYTLTLTQIEGFTFEEGFRYVLNIRITKLANPPVDGISKTYKLLQITSKVKE
ncbi:DUF4377 domain-containing protein [Elizabethkingia anophelis]|uniref:DUF4377 domain-containing protein n=1 Tax=Elizabethkingia anophelis TaxID=1117645 RepID=UPI000C6EB72C|nr:DUF4377 domain-containing protein [Elizabethkingia anophelis]MCT3697432.1 DUF4377 domain-containing protein [Elizabethkingia anophelis]MCT3758930.1 DUF4377 domain-containing protein [Elizabethkingia anophelis]MCT3958981.1 DUF4377 domain-containing protein [Elizabethkingia anophelis]MCT3972478.1 DUF4377 domain-containing protein [Elizabethkingia anophelis]MCT4000953.1 DUF4377 domain-containing protein [Elizabethkingia anophelis]